MDAGAETSKKIGKRKKSHRNKKKVSKKYVKFNIKFNKSNIKITRGKSISTLFVSNR